MVFSVDLAWVSYISLSLSDKLACFYHSRACGLGIQDNYMKRQDRLSGDALYNPIMFKNLGSEGMSFNFHEASRYLASLQYAGILQQSRFIPNYRDRIGPG